MKLVFIYGPPAVGKYTVATELSKLTGYKLFHNHVTVDMVMTLFDFGSREFFELTDKFRLEMIDRASTKGMNVILTLVYGGRRDEAWIRKVISVVGKHNGEVIFVRLFADRKQLFKRLKSSSRKKFRKIRDRKTLEEVISKYDVFSEIPFVESFSIDNTKLQPKSVAKKIASYYDLL